jgi:hypothetical protein
MQRLDDVVKSYRIHIYLLAHTSKTNPSDNSNRDNEIVQLSDLKGSSSIAQIAWNVISVYRVSDKERLEVLDKNGFGVTLVYVLKKRAEEAKQGRVALRFCQESNKLFPFGSGENELSESSIQNYRSFK